MPSRFPFPLPNGWFRVAFADELNAPGVRALHYFGQDLVLAVFEDGTPRVFDAHCPHLGAHLGRGGSIESGALRCPFHGWRFGPDGACVNVEYATRVPATARLREWPTRVRNGIVWVWHHAAGDAPTWEVPEIEIVDHPDWTPLLHERFTVRTHNQEIAENTADPAHFVMVHGFSQPAPPVLTFDGTHYRSTTHYDSPRRDGSTIASSLDVAWYGLGMALSRSHGALELAFIGSGTPVDENEIDYCFSFTVCHTQGFALDSGAGKAAIDEAMRQVQQDIPIWENKRYIERPPLCDGDGPIPRFREWASQFYTAGTDVPA